MTPGEGWVNWGDVTDRPGIVRLKEIKRGLTPDVE